MLEPTFTIPTVCTKGLRASEEQHHNCHVPFLHASGTAVPALACGRHCATRVRKARDVY